MNRYPGSPSATKHLATFALMAATVAFPLSALAGTVNLATQPMATNTTSSVHPNIMFILDDSGSMRDSFLPDWADDSHPTLGTPYTNIPQLFTNNGFNGVAYSPAITYTPPVYYSSTGSLDTTTYPNIGSPWTSVKDDAFGVQSTGVSDLTQVGDPSLISASYYYFTPGEYCSTPKLTSCVTSTVATTTYPIAAGLRWCKDAALTSCQAINNTTYKYPRFPGQTSAARLAFNGGGSMTGITVNTAPSRQILAGNVTGTNQYFLAYSIAKNINACTAAITGNCTVKGYSAAATPSGAVIIFAPASLSPMNSTITLTGNTASVKYKGAFDNSPAVPGSNNLVNVVPTTTTYVKAATRSDCAGATSCTYAEEMTNYANWWTYYHTRLQAMKSSVSRAFSTLDGSYRVGFTTISDKGATNGATFLGNNDFATSQKYTWFKDLLNANVAGATPLRGALSKAGRYYGGKFASSSSPDPVQYSCQQNFVMLSTDGYWNTSDETTSYGPYALDGSTLVGNRDGSPTARPMLDVNAQSNTLADVAKYYYDTDLRPYGAGNTCPVGGKSVDYPSGNPDVCNDNVFGGTGDDKPWQHMTTFTMGLGADGTLQYQSDYATATSGDYYDLSKGNSGINWPSPVVSSTGGGPANIDDLWHAAVNGHGTYFSAKDPDQIVYGFRKALNSISAKIGSAAAAATSTLTPTKGNNLAYVASYTTTIWKGNLEAHAIDPDTGNVSDTANWCAETIPSPCSGTLASDPITQTWTCTVSSSAAACPPPPVGAYDAANGTCTTVATPTCTGTMLPTVHASSDDRIIYTAPSGSVAPLTGQNLTYFDDNYATDTANATNFNAAHISGLSQWPFINQSAATGVNLIRYLRGQFAYDDRNTVAADRLYRMREAVLGDAMESQPAYIGAPTFNYSYAGYQAFKTAQASRVGTVYLGTNDGMLHAFDGTARDPVTNAGTGGNERWAYVPSMVIPNMWKLADKNYSSKHIYLVNGSPIISDVYDATAGWRTILVAGLNAGGRGYYALDITNPTKPILLWEFTPNNGDKDLGYSFGKPVITRKSDGTWVVVFTSGYDNGTSSSTLVDTANPGAGFVNNSPTGSGEGILYVVEANTGKLIHKISTGVGTQTQPSGLGQIAIWNNDSTGNEAGYIYSGDLLGNVWKFDIESAALLPATQPTPQLFATLKDSNGNAQPVTTTPILGLVNSKPVVFVGTGKYLEVNDLTDKGVQSFYAIKDDGTSVGDPRSHIGMSMDKMVQQPLNLSTRTIASSPNKVNFLTDRGWFIDFPLDSTASGSERVNIDPMLVAGTLIVPTIVPANSVCSPGGWGWLNYFDYATGSALSVRYDAPIVGINVLYIHGKPVVSVVTAKKPKPDKASTQPKFDTGSASFQGKRSIWRELLPNQ